MTPERWQQVEEVLQAALDRPPHERASFLNEACSTDEELRQEASSLIDAYDEAGEFIDGQTLRELIAQEHLSLVEVLEIAIQVAEALTAAHAAGIVHRDIKPENIMRRRSGLVKLLDFGIAKLLEPPSSDSKTAKTQTETGVVLGTVGYMSPEQARALPVDERTDIWSLGVVLYEMLAYRPPFVGATRMDTMVAILERAPAPLFQFANNAPPVLSVLQHVVSKALRKEIEKR